MPSSTPTAVDPTGTQNAGAGYTGNPNDQQSVDAYLKSLGYTGPSMGIPGSTAPAGTDQAAWDQETSAAMDVLQHGFTADDLQHFQQMTTADPSTENLLGLSPSMWALIQDKAPSMYAPMQQAMTQQEQYQASVFQKFLTDEQNAPVGSGQANQTINLGGQLRDQLEAVDPSLVSQIDTQNGLSGQFWSTHTMGANGIQDNNLEQAAQNEITNHSVNFTQQQWDALEAQDPTLYEQAQSAQRAARQAPSTAPNSNTDSNAPFTPFTPNTTPSPTQSGAPLNVPAPLQAPSSSPSQTSTDPNGMPSVTTTPTTPGNSLLNSTITPGPATNRYAIAQQEYNDWVAQSDPQFQASMRDSNRYAAAAGQIGSGQATNSIGDIETQRENAMRTSRDTFLGNALTGSIDDAYKNVGIAQQQQGFQAGQQQTGFNQSVQLQELANSEQGQQYSQMMQSMGFNAAQIQQAFQNAFNVQQLSNSQDAQSFYQALEQEIQGSQGDPAQILAWISGQYARGAAA